MVQGLVKAQKIQGIEVVKIKHESDVIAIILIKKYLESLNSSIEKT